MRICIDQRGVVEELNGNQLDIFLPTRFHNSTEGISGSCGLTSTDHSSIVQLIHFIPDGPANGFGTLLFRERVGFPFLERLTWYSSPTMERKIYQTEFTRSLGFLTTERSYKLYEPDGKTVAISAIDTITYVSGVFESSRTREFI